MELLYALLRLRNKLCFCMRIKSNIMTIFMIALFIIISMIVGILIICFTSSKPNTTCQLKFKRTMQSSIISSSKPRSVAVGDFNNDHRMDITVANSGTDTIGVFLSKDDGTFENQEKYSTNSYSYPCSVAVSNFNNDNYSDIAVANYGTNNIGIFLGKGNGRFTDQKIFSLYSSRPLFITTGDCNMDNRMDIIVANSGTNTVGILFAYGNGLFQDQVTYFTGYDSMPYSIAVGDFNNDSQLDIAIANYGTNNIGILLGNGNGTFANQQIYTTLPKSNPSSIGIGDFNNDNYLDIIVSNNGTGNVGIFIGRANGTFLPQTIYSIGFNSYPQYLTVGDFNNDSQLDIVIVDSINDQVHIVGGYENETFDTITTYNTISGSSPLWVAVADFDNDNQSDIVIANYGTNNVEILTDYFMKPSAKQTMYSFGMVFDVSDFNNDHIPDIASAVNGYICILFGLDNRTFSREAIYSIGNGFNPHYMCAGDLNNDNRMDIVFTNLAADGVSVFLGHGDGTFRAIGIYSTGIGSTPWWLALGDVNNDKQLDIVSANTGTDSIGILLGNGDGTFGAMMNYSIGIGSAPSSVALGDINNDNHLDIVVTTTYTGVTVFLGHGNGTFTIVMTYYLTSAPFSIALADFNNDNRLDIVIANRIADNIGVFLGCGNGTFQSQIPYSTGYNSHPFYVIVTDFNNDNIDDIATTNFGTDEVVIFYGYGNGSFYLARTYPTGYGSKPYVMTTADFYNGQQVEIIVGLWGTDNLEVLTEYYAAKFVNQTICSTGAALQPYSVTVGDFNNDNRSDIVVVNSGTDNLDILFNSGNGTFNVEITYSIDINSQPQYVITCDINNDNQLDIVSVNSKLNSISVIMGNGNGSFAKQITYGTIDGSHPYAVASGDFNNDNRLDLVVVNEGTDNINVFLGFDYTTFQSPEIYSSTNNVAPYRITVSDFNNDTFPDIATTFFLSSSLGILLGYGNGSFSIMMIYSTGYNSYPSGIAADDMNNDGRSDIIVANWNTNNIGILLGYGNGTFADIITYSTGANSNPSAVDVGDFNNDGRLDIVEANYGGNSVGVLLGYGNGSFTVVKIYLTGEGSHPFYVTTSDLNNDRILDIVVANRDTANIGVLLGYGDGTFANQAIFSLGLNNNPYSVIAGDFNNDGRFDIAAGNRNLNSVGILLGYGNGTFTGVQYFTTGDGSLPRGLSVGDFNNDNHLDIAVANSGTNSIVVLFGLGDGDFLVGRLYLTGSRSEPFELVIGDFNNDKRLDIAVANYDSSNVAVFLAYGKEPFAGCITYSMSAGSQPHSVAVSDFNNDGWSDFVVANYGTNNVGIILGYGNGKFTRMMPCLTGVDTAPYSLAVADFNNDNHLDIVVTNSGTDNVAILLGYGNGTFSIERMYSTGLHSRPYTVAIGDLNNDNISDIVTANSGTNNVFILYGYGNGTFGNEISYPFGYGSKPHSVTVKNLNGDGLMDIAVACYGTNHIEILTQMC